jgi:hypothetical protein
MYRLSQQYAPSCDLANVLSREEIKNVELRGVSKDIEIISEEKASCRRHRTTHKKPVLRRVWPTAKDSGLTPCRPA